PVHSADAVEARLARAEAAQQAWAERPLAERLPPLLRAAELLRRDKRTHAELMVKEMGKPIAQAEGEVEKCAWAFEHYAETAEAGLAAEKGGTDFESLVRYDPLGVILAIMPWNFPYWQVVRFAAPNLAAGNAGLLKHAENVTGCAMALEALMREAGFPEGVFSTLVVPVSAVEGVIADPRVAAVTLTGSTRAGAAVAEAAGRHLKKTVLELGGSDAYVVLEDADIELAVARCAGSRLLNSGQSCIAAKRFVVLEPVYDAFVEALVARFEKTTMGEPMSGVDIGPLAREDLRDGLAGQVEASIAKGARPLVGGKVPAGPGWFYPPTVLTEVAPGMPAYGEELFGPAASVLRAQDEQDALRIANDSVYGLGGAVFSKDLERAHRFAARMNSGAVAINDFVKSDPRLPFGGIKKSGYGRELGLYGLREFVNTKTVTVGAV
ncbi:MAG: NAD-dependent succinate-semialdehyde dehydrogenase, partial [Myxococcota bacterium]